MKVLRRYHRLSGIKRRIFATEHTHEFFGRYGIITELLHKIHEQREPNILTFLKEKRIEMVLSIPKISEKKQEINDTYMIRRIAVDYSVPVINNVQLIRLLADALTTLSQEDLKILAWDEYE